MSYNLSSDFALPANPATVTRDCSRGSSITVEATDKATATGVLWDIQSALENGAAPAAHAVMIVHLNKANESGTPLAMRLGL